MNFKQYYKSKQDTVNRQLKKLFVGKKIPKRLKEAIHYSLHAGGKRLRSVLCLMVDDVLRKQFHPNHHPDIYRLALSLECIHTYSLIHDDLPSMDNDDLRRGKPTCHIQYDEATATLAGDSLLTLAFELYGELEKVKSIEVLKKLVLTLSSSSGAEGMVGGQMLDIEAGESNVLNRPKHKLLADLRKIHMLKTGALIKASVLLPVHYHRQKPNAFEKYANAIGMAFQIVDDILDVTSTSEILGKPAGSDVENRKLTYVSLLDSRAPENRLRKPNRKPSRRSLLSPQTHPTCKH